MMPLYATEYVVEYAPSFMVGVKGLAPPCCLDGVPQPAARYGSHLWATDAADARSIAKRRRLGERILGQSPRCYSDPLSSILFRRRNYGEKADLIHSLTWLGFIAAKSGAATLDELWGDTGVIHQAVHYLQFGTETGETVTAGWVYEALRRLERRVPGLVEIPQRLR
jgi:hypothetical protein